MLAIKKLREKNNISQTELASKLNITQGAISQWEKGLASPSIDKMPELAKVLGCEISDLFGNESEAG